MDNVLKKDLIAEVRNIINANENNDPEASTCELMKCPDHECISTIRFDHQHQLQLLTSLRN